MSATNISSWYAVGLDHTSEKRKRLEGSGYFGFAAISDPDNYNPTTKPGIWIFNYVLMHKLNKGWQYGLCFSYRRDYQYNDDAPFELADPGLRQEYRARGRVEWTRKIKRYDIAITFRQEFRKFYTTDFQHWPLSYSIRSRLRFRVKAAVSSNQRHHLIGMVEGLFSADRFHKQVDKWTNYTYDDTRFVLFYTYQPQGSFVNLQLGYMYNIIGTQPVNQVHSLAVCVGFEWIRKAN